MDRLTEWGEGPEGDKDVLAFINDTPLLLSLLYDLGLLPEQHPDHGSPPWEKIFIITNHWREATLQSLSQEAVREEALEEAAKVCDARIIAMKSHTDGAGHVTGADFYRMEIDEVEYIAADIRALKREPNAAAESYESAHPKALDEPAPAAPDVAKMVEELREWGPAIKIGAAIPRAQVGDLMIQAAALLAKLGQGWIPVSERLPEEGKQVICWCEHTRNGAWFFGLGMIRGTFADEPCWRVPPHDGDFGGIQGKVTHWTPLPPAPGASDD